MNISLIIPCYNEELNIQKGVLDKIGNYTRDNDDFLEILIVDDGSTDSSKQSIKEKYLNKFPKFQLIENPHQGKALAVITGIKAAKASHVIFCDIDLATPIEESEKMIEHFNKGESIVIGSRAFKREGAPFMRRLQSKGFTVIRNMLVGLPGIRDTQCGFKGFEHEAALKIIHKMKVFSENKLAHGSSVSAGFDLEFLFVARKLGYAIVEIPVAWRHAESKNVTFIKDSIETIRDILKIRWNEITHQYN